MSLGLGRRPRYRISTSLVISCRGFTSVSLPEDPHFSLLSTEQPYFLLAKDEPIPPASMVQLPSTGLPLVEEHPSEYPAEAPKRSWIPLRRSSLSLERLSYVPSKPEQRLFTVSERLLPTETAPASLSDNFRKR